VSHAGDDYEVNEDFSIAAPHEGIFLVADGLGGKPRGDLASRTAAEAFFRHITAVPLPSRLDDEQIRNALALAHDTIRQLAASASQLTGMGTTLSAAVFNGSRGRLVHVGDSRIYHYRRPELRLLTQDHTVAAELQRQNQLSTEKAAKSPMRHWLSRTVGMETRLEPDLSDIELFSHDLLLLATDGLAKALDEADLKNILDQMEGAPPQELCERIFRRAAASPLHDNVTFVIAEFCPMTAITDTTTVP
jgi:protein phosphatase